MRAGFSDPQVGLRWRVLPYALARPPLLCALRGPIDGWGSTLLAVGFGAVFHFVGLLERRPEGMRHVELVLGPGYVVVEGEGMRKQRIVFADVVGATTARTESGFLLSLQLRNRNRPVTLHLETEADVDTVRRLLGIGHDGFGVVSWQTQPRAEEHTERIARVVFGMISLLLVPVLAVTRDVWRPDAVLVLLLLSIAFVLLFATVARFISLFAPHQRGLSMTARGLEVRTHHAATRVPYADIANVQAHDEAIALLMHPPDGKPLSSTIFVPRASSRWGGISDDEAAIMTAQVRAAAQRAHGFGKAKQDVASRLDVLRRNRQSLREWLERLDVLARMLAEGSGYRGTTIDPADLWTVLEDPEGDSMLRTAAARLLRHRSEASTRIRIDAALATVRDAEASKRLRIAVEEDVEHASRELAELEPVDAAERAPLFEGAAREVK